MSFEKWITPQWQAELSFKNEDKTGARVTGRGYACAAYVCNSTQSATNQTFALLMLPEPVNSSIRQIEAKLNFRGQALNLSAGYYGSFYTNNFGSYQATVPNILNNPLGAPTTLAPAVASSVIAGGGLSLQNVLQLPFSLPPTTRRTSSTWPATTASHPPPTALSSWPTRMRPRTRTSPRPD